MINASHPTSENLLQFIEFQGPLSKDAYIALRSRIKEQTYKKGEHVVNEGSVCKKIFFLNTGLVKTLFTADARDFIMRFFPEGHVFSVLDSFIEQKPSIYRITDLEYSTVSYILYEDLQKLCSEHHQIETFYRKLLSMAVVEMMSRVGHSLEETGVVAYNRFIKDQGHLLQRISLADLASYLGITQVSLSRIRRGS